MCFNSSASGGLSYVSYIRNQEIVSLDSAVKTAIGFVVCTKPWKKFVLHRPETPWHSYARTAVQGVECHVEILGRAEARLPPSLPQLLAPEGQETLTVIARPNERIIWQTIVIGSLRVQNFWHYVEYDRCTDSWSKRSYQFMPLSSDSRIVSHNRRCDAYRSAMQINMTLWIRLNIRRNDIALLS